MVLAVLLTAGYAASQWFYFSGLSAGYAKSVDTPSVRLLMLILLLAVVGLSITRRKEES